GLERLRDLAAERVDGAGRPGAIEAALDLPGLVRRLSEQAEDLAALAETARASVGPLADDGDALARVTHQLWEAIQAIRVVPVRGLFQRLARVAREAARVEGRRVEVVMVGEDIGLDNSVQDKAYE